VTIENSILWGDKRGAAADEIDGAVTVIYSDIEVADSGVGNISADPQFVDAANGLFYLRPTSPCIDIGAAGATSALDLDANPRVQDGDGSGAAQVDMGAYEYQPNVMAFVLKYYQDILGRPADAGGAQSWTMDISRVTSFGIGVNEGFLALAKTFFTCTEYLSENKSDRDYVIDLYQTFLNRMPDEEEIDTWVDNLQSGLTRNGAMECFAYCAEFAQLLQQAFGNTQARPENNLVNDFYRGILGRFPDAGGYYYWLGLMRDAQCTGAQAVRDISRQLAQLFFGSSEYAGRNHDNSGYVEDLYDAILRRGPDPGGFSYWVGQLAAGAITRNALLNAFINSSEFQGRVQTIIDAGCMQ
jgi:hypothetical protein